MATTRLLVNIEANSAKLVSETKKARESIDSIKQSTDGMVKAAQGVQNAMAAFTKMAGIATAIYGVVKSVQAFADEAREAEQIESRMAFQIQAVGYNFKEVKPMVDDFATSVQKTTRFSDELARQGLGKMMQYTTDLNTAMQATKLSMDISTQTGRELDEVITLVGMAINGNVERLGRWVPELRNLDDVLGKNATAAEKAAYAIKILNEKFGGAAQADVDTYAGKLEQLNNQWKDVKETIGREVVIPGLKNWLDWLDLIISTSESASKAQENFWNKMLGGSDEFMRIEEHRNKMRAWRAAEEKAGILAGIKAEEDAENKRKALAIEQFKIDTEYQSKYLSLIEDRVGAIKVERDKVLLEAWQKGLRLVEIEKYFNAQIIEIEKDKTKQIRDYNEKLKSGAVDIMEGLGLKTEAGAASKITPLLTQYQKLKDSGLFSPEQLETARQQIIAKLNEIKAAYSDSTTEIVDELRDAEGELKVRWTQLVPKDEMTQNIESMIRTATDQLDKLKESVKGPYTPLIDDSSIKNAIENINLFEQRLMDIVNRSWAVQINITGTGSSEAPIMDKIQEIYGGFDWMSTYVSQMKFKLELSSLNEQIQSLQNWYVAENMRSMTNWVPGAYSRYVTSQYQTKMAPLLAQKSLLEEAQGYFLSGGAGSFGGGGGGGVSINIGVINVSGDNSLEVAENLDAALADLIQKDRSKLKQALKS